MPSTSRGTRATKSSRKAAKPATPPPSSSDDGDRKNSTVATPEPRWRPRAADRVTRALRARAGARNDRFLQTALQLLSDGRSDFSVREFIEMSQMSTRSFYESFDGKDDLLLAIYEEAATCRLSPNSLRSWTIRKRPPARRSATRLSWTRLSRYGVCYNYCLRPIGPLPHHLCRMRSRLQ